MLMRLRKRQRGWAALMAVWFAVGTCSLACRVCLAHQQAAMAQQNVPRHCHPGDGSESAPRHTPADHNCQGACDCAGAAVDTTDVRVSAPLAAKPLWAPDRFQPYLLNLEAAWVLRPPGRAREAPPGPLRTPERARYLPLERFCVLLN